MKKYFISVLIFLNTILLNYVLAQDKIVRLSPEIGDTIDLIENNYYNLFSEIKDFQYAMIYLHSDSTSITKISCQNDGGLVRDTVITNSTDYLGNLKACIRQINSDRLENFESDDKITVTKLNREKFVGKLLAVQDSSFILVSDTISDVGTLTILKTYERLNASEVESIFIESGYWSDVGIGAGIGGAFGLFVGGLIGGNQPVDENSFYADLDKFNNTFYGALLGMLAGASVGFAAGLLLATPDETIQINSANDLERLKEYVVQ